MTVCEICITEAAAAEETFTGAWNADRIEDKEAEEKMPENQKRELWYWFDRDGVMATGWKEINGQWEMFADDSEWLHTWDGN